MSGKFQHFLEKSVFWDKKSGISNLANLWQLWQFIFKISKFSQNFKIFGLDFALSKILKSFTNKSYISQYFVIRWGHNLKAKHWISRKKSLSVEAIVSYIIYTLLLSHQTVIETIEKCLTGFAALSLFQYVQRSGLFCTILVNAVINSGFEFN